MQAAALILTCGRWRRRCGRPRGGSVRGGGCASGVRDVAVAKIWASEGVRRVVQTAQHLHGGFGADVDYPLHRYHAWAKQLELSLGPAAAHEEALGICSRPITWAERPRPRHALASPDAGAPRA